MKLKHVILMSVITAAGCSQSQKDGFSSYEDYPAYKGEWEEMVYSPSSTHFALWYRQRNEP